ncbi:MAG: type I glutamate--ammonia ligase [Planctomycetes bacterium]|nr:type I glutamate--ammonia ligase [Planctomycetota bacterium]MBI3845711.1 type I glutamate--ammonia ligase [Planctomycetota bacterium]
MKTAGGASASVNEILRTTKQEKVRFLRLQFTDILGQIKNVEVPERQFDKALDGEVLFDGSSIEGFARIEESDMLLKPDLSTFAIFPWEAKNGEGQGRVARIICDIYHPNGEPFAGCPRQALKRVVARAAKLGYATAAGSEAEFFLFHKNATGEATTITHDSGGYFDLAPIDKGEECRREIVNVLEAMGFEIEAAHHEVAPGQHEIDFKYQDMIRTADNLSTFRFVVRKVALDFGLHATFMPKPLFGENGSGMHTHQSLFRDSKNAFYDPKGKWQLSKVALAYIAGLLRHARGFCAITNPLINSYKRLVPGYEAPTHITWSERNRSPLARVPDRRGDGTRVELRMPDPACNPYLAFTVMLASGLDGIANGWDPGEPVNKNIYKMSYRERRKHRIDSLPGDLNEALALFEKDDVVKEALGEHVVAHFLEAKRQEWQDYIAQVHPWELDRYLSQY